MMLPLILGALLTGFFMGHVPTMIIAVVCLFCLTFWEESR